MYERTSKLGSLTRVAALALLAASSATVGCASSDTHAPFDIYTSPLLASEIQPARPASRSFDPLRLGDHEVSDTVYVSNDSGSRWDSAEDRKVSGPVAQGAAPSRPVGRAARSAPAPAVAPAVVPAVVPPTLSTTNAKATAPKTKAPAATDDKKVSPDAGSSFQPDHAAGYVWSVYGLNGVALPDAARDHIPAVYKHCKADGRITHSSDALPGDLVFFHNTFDKNADGRNNDWYTHVGLVHGVDDAGTIAVLSYVDDKVSTFQLNLRTPDETVADGRPVNAQLRRPSADDAPFTQHHAGQLFAGFCRLFADDRADLLVVDNWQPGMDLQRPAP